ncbi:FAD-dependent oxidoreductase [Mucilaginibacter robiniae]|uniref:FAD-dependent oxidoreductase n=1 Tax=Mucilaginibacter robiniae TaxID=2728022 RepID=A0A7L5E5L5_9SPHI|nr:NAD(P)/FAD-dependent oxidoreductase [Mucilaginibacter robiniae]QJD97918.1 FAD-dependent oxidoreductase [Mucilaginibacter robiniae]
MNSTGNIVIIGGGLSGLTLAYLLFQKGIEATVLEASSRLGGRIQTIKGTQGTPLELGATWLSDLHTNLLELTNELGLTKYPQYSGGISLFQTKSFEPPQKFFVPEAENPSYRIAGGTQMLIDRLAEELNKDHIHLNKKVSAIKQMDNDSLIVEVTGGTIFRADQVMICIPPQLAAAHITFTPELPETVTQILPAVQTWMAGALKFTIEYSEPFWRKEGYSGMLYSHAGMIVEMYDHTNFEEDKFGFIGFLNSGAAGYNYEVRKEFVLRQLVDLFGKEAAMPLDYQDKFWNDELLIAGNPTIQRPHQFNGHPLLQEVYMNGKLYFCGTETSLVYGGYMEGAVTSAKRIAERVIQTKLVPNETIG